MRHVLLIEDNPAHAKLVTRHLSRFEPTPLITHLSDGESAENYLRQLDQLSTPPSLVLLDLRLPRVDGIDLLSRIRKPPISLSIPVIVLTSSERDEDIQGAYSAGANSYLVKPVAYDLLEDLIRRFGDYWLLNRTPSVAGG